MGDNQETNLSDTLCDSVQNVWAYLQCDCGSESCPFNQLLRRVQRQKERERIETERVEAEWQQRLDQEKLAKDD